MKFTLSQKTQFAIMDLILKTFFILCCVSGCLGQVSPKDIHISTKTIKNLCEIPEFQEAMAADEELEPAAVVYEVMSKRLERLESQIKDLEKRLETAPSHQDIEVVAAALRRELMDHINERIDTLTTELENNVESILRNLMSNLASLGYEYGFGIPTESTPSTTTEQPYRDCSYLASKGSQSGVHALNFDGEVIEAFCDIRDRESAWLVIQRRVDATVDFFLDWSSYKEGFGDLMGNFYFGNEKLHIITSARPHMLRIDLVDATGDTGYAEYANFVVANETEGYRLRVGQFLGGKIGDALKSVNGSQFSTYDRDRDGSALYSCAGLHKGGFWYGRCGSANPNGVYGGSTSGTYNWQNVFWYTWKQDLRGLRRVEMKLMPMNL